MKILPSIPLARALIAAVAMIGLPVVGARAAGFTTLHNFYPLVDGNTPSATLVQGADGLLYGTATVGGAYSNGSLYRFAPDGSNFTVLNNFPGVNAGVQPRGGLVQARDGNFYGTTYRGGSSNEGTLFQLTPGGILTYIEFFLEGAVPGASPSGTLVEGRDGMLRGTAQYGGLNNFGTIYRFTPAFGPLSVDTTFSGGVNGSYPLSDLCLGNDGNFYGTTTYGGQYNQGVFFRLGSGGGFTVLYNFTGGADGGMPSRGVVQGIDSAFYGVAQIGGTYGTGTVFRLAVVGTTATPTVLHAFSPSLGDGATPQGRLAAASNGILYGTASGGGNYNNGCIFLVTASGGYSTIYSFTNTSDGGNPAGGLIQANDGKLYGTTAPANGAAGTVFRLDLGLPLPPPAPQALLTTTAATSATVFIQGRHFVGATAVRFAANGQTLAATSFQVLSDTMISAVVPSGAVTGTVSVTSNGQTVNVPGTLTVTFNHPAFFKGEIDLPDGVEFLQFPNSYAFGYFTFLSDPNYLYHFDLGFEYVIDANDGASGVYFYDFASDSFFYTSPSFPFPYLYDFKLKAFLFYFPDTNNPGHYTSNPRYFYDFGTNTIITK